MDMYVCVYMYTQFRSKLDQGSTASILQSTPSRVHACRLGRHDCDGSGAAHSEVPACEYCRLQRFGLVGQADGAYEHVSREQGGVYPEAHPGSNIGFLFIGFHAPVGAREICET